MSTKVQIRRGSTSSANAFTGAEGELYVDTDQNDLRVHDGSTPGGFRLPNFDVVSELNSTKVDKLSPPFTSLINTIGSSTSIPVITFNEQGQITAVSSASIDLSTKVDKINISGGTIGSGSAIPIITYNSQGQITAVSSSALNIPSNIATETYVNTQVATKQNTLVSGTNIKTVNGQSIVGSGNVVAGGLGGMTAWFTRPNVTPAIAFSGTWTVPTGVTTIKVTLTSAGGGAGRFAVGRYSGGGSGSSIIAYVSVTPGSQISWTRGAAGLAGVNDGENGGNGGESNITVGGSQILRALGGIGGGQSFGGQGGQYIISTSSAIIGAIGVHGQAGGSVPSAGDSINEYGSAMGASSIWGGGSVFYNSEGAVTLRHGTGGAAGSGQGRPGGDGVVMIEW